MTTFSVSTFFGVGFGVTITVTENTVQETTSETDFGVIIDATGLYFGLSPGRDTRDDGHV